MIRPTPEPSDASELDALRARIAELEAREAEHERSERVQAALYRIAEAASGASDLQAFYREVHATVATLMSAKNFYIALYDDRRKAINFPYYVDAVDTDIPDPNLWEPFGVGNARGTTAYVLRTGQPELIDLERHEQLVTAGEVESLGVIGGEWLGAPLGPTNGRSGLSSARTTSPTSITPRRTSTCSHSSASTSVRRSPASGRSRRPVSGTPSWASSTRSAAPWPTSSTSRPSSISSVSGSGRSSSRPPCSSHCSMRPRTRSASAYSVDAGHRLEPNAIELGPGLTSVIIKTGRPVRAASDEEAIALGAVQIGGSDTESFLGVPIMSGDRVTGVIGLERLEKSAFGENDERLLSTLATSMGVALENARLFDETKRLLAETDHRARELSVINEIGAALAKQLDFHSIVELIGKRDLGDVRRTFDVRRHVRQYHGLDHVPVRARRGPRVEAEPIEYGSGLTSIVIETGKPAAHPDPRGVDQPRAR